MLNFNTKELYIVYPVSKIYKIDIEPIEYVRRTRADSWKKLPRV